MTLIVRTRYDAVAALLRPYEINDKTVVYEQRPEQVPIAAVSAIGTSEGDGITERHDLNAELPRRPIDIGYVVRLRPRKQKRCTYSIEGKCQVQEHQAY